MTTVSQSQTGLNIAFQPTDELIQQCQQQWQSIRGNTSDEDAQQFEMVLVAALSRLTGYKEAFSGNVHGSGSGRSL